MVGAVVQLEPGAVHKLVAFPESISIFTQALCTANEFAPCDESSSVPINQKLLQSLLPLCVVGFVEISIPSWMAVVGCSEG